MKSSGPIATSIDEYIAAAPAEVRPRLTKLRAAIRRAAPDAVEKICYRMPTFALNGNLVHFAAFTHHIGFYPGASGVAHFIEQLKPYQTAKGSIQFPLDGPVPFNLVTRIVKFRVEENTRPKSKASEASGKSSWIGRNGESRRPLDLQRGALAASLNARHRT